MRNSRFVFLLSAVCLIAAGLMWQASKETSSLVLLASDLPSKGGDLRRIRVGARVAPLPIDYQVEPAMRLAFTIEDQKSSDVRVPVIYEGLKPDMFAPGRDVIIDGDYRGGTLYATKLLTQCPSKYEPPSVTESGK